MSQGPLGREELWDRQDLSASREFQEVPENPEDREDREQPDARERKERGENPEHRALQDFQDRWDLLDQRVASERLERREKRVPQVSRDSRAKEAEPAAMVNPVKGENQGYLEHRERGVCRVQLEFLEQPGLEEKRACRVREGCPDLMVLLDQRGLRDP